MKIKKEISYEICKDCPYYYGEIDWCMSGEPDVPDDMEKMCEKEWKNKFMLEGIE